MTEREKALVDAAQQVINNATPYLMPELFNTDTIATFYSLAEADYTALANALNHMLEQEIRAQT